jgi:hypothetical protein
MSTERSTRRLEIRRYQQGDHDGVWDLHGLALEEAGIYVTHGEVEKQGECKDGFGNTFYYDNLNKKPLTICNALLHVLDLYAWRVALGFPSWNADDRTVYRIHCPDATGTIWEMRKIETK